MNGIDISSFQSNLDFSKVTQEVIYIKATQGLTYINPCLKLHYEKAKAKGMKVGFYHFLEANDPILEAKHFLSTIEGLQSDCKYVIDIETNPIGATARTRKFADYLISQNKEPCIYTGASFYAAELTSIVKDLPVWIASYCKTRPSITSVGWQYSQGGSIGGVSVDLDIFDSGILLKGVGNVATSIVDVEVQQIQQTCNKLNITGKNGKVLTEDGIQGTNTTEATARLKSILNNILK